jgi:hypothetical protein
MHCAYQSFQITLHENFGIHNQKTCLLVTFGFVAQYVFLVLPLAVSLHYCKCN